MSRRSLIWRRELKVRLHLLDATVTCGGDS